MARKRTKKATTRVDGNVITHDSYKFKSEYSDFKSEMEGVSGGDIGVKSKNLFSMIADHGVPVRDGSPNAGKAEKTSTLISEIESKQSRRSKFFEITASNLQSCLIR